jgi:hypothetical protein
VILWGLDRYPAHTVAERIRSVVEETRFPNEKVLPGGRLTVSIGLAECPADAEDRGDLISAADRGLYIAKRTGRNRVEMAPPDQRRERRGRFARHIAYRVGGAAGTAPPQEALTLNLSTGGVCLLAASGALAVGQLVEVQLAAPAEDKALLGHVVWQVPRPHEQCQVGVKFVNLSAKDARWIETLMGH